MSQAINARQLEVLSWIADGCPGGHWPVDDFSYKLSAGALQNRGLATLQGRGRAWSASITDAGTYYLKHGEHPPRHGASRTVGRTSASATDEPSPEATPAISLKAAETLAEARELIQTLSAEGTVELRDPVESTRALYRRLLHACREHHLVPTGLELRFTGRDAGDIVIALVDGSTKAESDWLRIRTTARRITINVDALRRALQSNPRVLAVSDELRPRAIEFAVALAHELRAYDLRLGVNVKLKTPKLFIQVDGQRRDIRVFEVRKDVPHVRTRDEDREARRNPWKNFPTVDSVPSGVLRVTVARSGWDKDYQRKQDQWSDKPKTPLEKQARLIAREIKAGVVNDNDERDRRMQAQAEQLEALDRKRSEERRVWEAIRRDAYGKAQEQLRQTAFDGAYSSWTGASELRHFCDALESSMLTSGEAESATIQTWITWARSQADALDPTKNLGLLNEMNFEVTPSDDDLRPFMEGWHPNAPQKDYSRPAAPSGSVTNSAPWHPGLRGKPSWWR